MNDSKVAAAAGNFMGRASLSRDPIVANDGGNSRRLVSCSGDTYTVESSWFSLMEDCYVEYDGDGDGIPEYYSSEYLSTDGLTGGVILAAQPSGASQVQPVWLWLEFVCRHCMYLSGLALILSSFAVSQTICSDIFVRLGPSLSAKVSTVLHQSRAIVR